jgi:hypothetical protein
MRSRTPRTRQLAKPVKLTTVSFDDPRAWYVVWWCDACKDEDFDPLDPPKPQLACTGGFVLEVTDQHILLGQEIFEDGHIRDVISIPGGMVKAITKVGVVKRPRGV